MRRRPIIHPMRAAGLASASVGLLVVLVSVAGSTPAQPGVTAGAAPVRVFSERFEGDLFRWVGKNGGAHSGTIVDDPRRQGNHVLRFDALASAGDVFTMPITVSKKKTYRLRFEYLGTPGEGGVARDLGGFIGAALETPGPHRWLAGTQPGGESDALVDDGRWRKYTIDFSPGAKPWTTPDGTRLIKPRSISELRLMLEDNVGSQGVPGDAYFDNITLDRLPEVQQEDVRVHVRFHANNLPTAPPSDGGQCRGATTPARVTGEITARIVDGRHEGSGSVVDTPHRSRCRVPVIGVRVDKVRVKVIKPGRIMKAKLKVHIDSEGVHRPGQCKVGTKGTITATYDDTKRAANSLRNHSLRIGPWKSPCAAHTHRINNNISSTTADSAGSTWVRVSIACPGPGFAPRNCGT
jgi:hypothetical protein